MGSGLPAALGQSLSFIVSLGVISVLFAMIFKFLPDVRVPLRKVWVGAIGTALLFSAGKELLALYLGRASTASGQSLSFIVSLGVISVLFAMIFKFLPDVRVPLQIER